MEGIWDGSRDYSQEVSLDSIQSSFKPNQIAYLNLTGLSSFAKTVVDTSLDVLGWNKRARIYRLFDSIDW